MNKSGPLIVLALLATTPCPAEQAGNFTLLDQFGASHELHSLTDRSAVVIMVQGNGCPIVRNAWPAFRDIRDKYQDRGIEFLMLNSNLQDDSASIQREAVTFRIDAPILIDDTQAVGESLKLIRTAEVFVIDPQDWEIVYRGPVDDRLTYERQKPQATEHYLRDAIDAVLAGQAIDVPERDALGCLIYFPDRQATL
jgi:hypothetical protein